MATFSSAEVAALQRQGNGKALETWLASWEPHDFPLPNGKERQRTKAFISEVFVRKRWLGQPTAQVAQSSAQVPAPAQTRVVQQTQQVTHGFGTDFAGAFGDGTAASTSAPVDFGSFGSGFTSQQPPPEASFTPEKT